MKTNSFLLCMDLQPYSNYCFSKISRTLFDFLNNTYWVSLFLRNILLIFWTVVSCFSVALFYSTLFCCGGKANLLRFTLFYSTLDPYGWTERQIEEQIHSLCVGWRNLLTLCVGWRNLFSSCAVVSVLSSGRK